MSHTPSFCEHVHSDTHTCAQHPSCVHLCSRQRRKRGCCSALLWCESQQQSCAMPELRLRRVLASPAFQKRSGGSACARTLCGVACALGSHTHNVQSEPARALASTDDRAAWNASIAYPVARLILCHGCGIARAARCVAACDLNPLSLCVLAVHCSTALRRICKMHPVHNAPRITVFLEKAILVCVLWCTFR